MRMSQLFSQTKREIPTEAETTSHQLLLQAGYIRQLSAGIFSYLPLARRVMTNIENIIRQEITAIGGQEITIPVVHPAEIWQQTGRRNQIGNEMGRFSDKNGHSMVLSTTHEDVIASLARNEVRSYRQLPQLLFHIQTKWRGDPRPRVGLLRAREFTMEDSYSLDIDQAGLDKQYEAHFQAYQKIFHRALLPVQAVKSSTGMTGEKNAHEFMYLSAFGEDTIIICEHCGYSANRQIALMKKDIDSEENELALQKVATPNCKTIENLAEFLSIPKCKTAKAIFMIATTLRNNQKIDSFIFIIVRGDMDVNETKLAKALQAIDLRPATEGEIREIGAVPGYASPVGVKNVTIIVDDIIPVSRNLVSGANEEGYHYLNVNYGRDYHADIITDITSVNAGDQCIQCGRPLHSYRAIEVGNITKLGTWISEAMGCSYLDSDGSSKLIYMGSYGIDIGRLLSCIVEEHHDEHGIIWPISVAPFQIHLVSLPWNNVSKEGSFSAEHIYNSFQDEGVEVLFDEREESPGVKFNDADLIGNPLRLTISERSIKNGGIEFKKRDSQEKVIIPHENVIPFVKKELKDSGFRK